MASSPVSRRSRVFWAASVASCLALCVFQVVDRATVFVRRPVETSVRLVRNDTVAFPRVTVCGHLLRGRERTLSTAFAALDATQCHQIERPALRRLFSIAEGHLGQLWTRDAVDDFRYKLNELKDKNGNKVAYVEVKMATLLGTCRTIAIETPVQAEKGKSLVLFRYERELSRSLYQRCFGPLKILLHQDNWSPLHKPMLTDAFSLSHSHNRMALSIKQFNRLNSSLVKCFDADSYFRCIHNCMENLLKSKLRCRLPYLTLSTLNECKTADEALTSYEESYKLLSSANLEKCDCSKQCSEVVYSSKFLTDNVGEITRSINTFINIPDGIIQVTEEYLVYDVISLLSDIGGNLGLYMGLCLLSLLDLFEIFIDYVRKYIAWQ